MPAQTDDAADNEAGSGEPRATILRLARERGPGKTICPSEAARALRGPDEKAWRLAMKPIRAEAVRLADEGLVEIRRKNKPVDPHDFKGVYRIAVVRVKQ